MVIQNLTTMLLQWSPPFLWPGHHIKYFRISVTNKENVNVILHDRVNATYSDPVVSFTWSIDEHQGQECTEFVFGISAVDDRDRELQNFNVIRGYPSSK